MNCTVGFQYPMCKLGEVVNNIPLIRIKEALDRGDIAEFNRLLQKSLSPEKMNHDVISFTGWASIQISTRYNSETFTLLDLLTHQNPLADTLRCKT